MPFSSSLLESSLDLSMAEILEPSPGLLLISSKMTSARIVLATIFALVSIIFALLAWQSWKEFWLEALWPWGLFAPFFALISLILFFSHQQKSFSTLDHQVILKAALGPLHFSKALSLPSKGEILISFRKEYPSSTQNHSSMPTRWYDINLVQQEGLGFTVANDRTAARDFAHRLAKFLNYSVRDEVEEDGVERINP